MTRHPLHSFRMSLTTGLLIGALYVGGVAKAMAHTAVSGMEYSAFCCQGNSLTGDCQPVSDETVTPIDGGFQIILNAGDHHMVTKRHVFTIPMKDVKWSTDGRYHVCLFPNEDTLRCFYAPPPGV